MKTRTIKTPIKCPRCGETVNKECPSCKGTGIVYVEETVTETGDYTPYFPYTPYWQPYNTWPKIDIQPYKWEPVPDWQVTWASTTLNVDRDAEGKPINLSVNKDCPFC